MSCWDIAVVAANVAVSEPKIRHHDLKVTFSQYSGPSRTSKNIPATTIVDLCNKAETGVGPSMAAGSHGCNPNCADFPAAAIKTPIRRRFFS